MYKDFSIHFTIKGQELSRIEQKFQDWSKGHDLLDENNTGVRVHNCFLSRKDVEERGFDTGVVDFIESLTDANDINWFYSSPTLAMSRVQMLTTIKRLGGIAIFVGEIKEGVLEEMNLARELGVNIILIP